VIGRRGRRGQVVLQTRVAPMPTLLLGFVLATMVLAIVVDGVERQAYASRYLSAGAGLFLVVVGCGIAVLPSRRARRMMLALLVVADLSVCLENAYQPRSQAYQVANVLNAQARPGDVIVYCPDQLGPSASRLTHTTTRQIVFPNFARPRIVDWVDYRERVRDADPASFSASVDRLAGPHALIDHFVASRGIPAQPVTRHPEYGETMSLNEYGPLKQPR
jgi:hypothetical protein